MEPVNYYVAMYYYQYEPYTAFHALYAHKEKLDFNTIWKEVRDDLEKNYPYKNYDDANEDYNEFIEQKADELLALRGFRKLEVTNFTTIGPDDSYDTFMIWEYM